MFFYQFPLIRQHDSVDCGLACLNMIFEFYGKKEKIQENDYLCYLSKDGVTIASIIEIAKKYNFEVESGKIIINQIHEVLLPCILFWEGNHFVVLYKIKKKKGKYYFYISDPAKERIVVDLDTFKKKWSYATIDEDVYGIVVLLQPLKNQICQCGDEKTHSKVKEITFYSFLISNKNGLIIILIGLFVGAFIQLLFPFFTQMIVDKGVGEGDVDFVIMLLLGQVFLIVGNMFNENYRRIFILKLGSKFSIKLLSDFVCKIINLPIKFFESKHVGDIIQRMQDYDKIERFVTIHYINFIFSIITFFVLACVLLFFSPIIFLVFLVGSILYLIWTLYFINRKRMLNIELFEVKSKNQSFIYEILRGIIDIKLLNQTNEVKDNIQKIQKIIYGLNLKTLRNENYTEVGNVFINEMKNIFILFISVYFVINEYFTFGTMMSIQYIVGELNVPIASIITFLVNRQDAKLSLERMNSIFMVKEELLGGIKDVNTVNGTMLFEHVSFKYSKSGDFILNDINFEIPLGSKVAIVGASGSGKTTLVKLLLKLYEPDCGSIIVNGINIKEIDSEVWRKTCGAVLQDGYIFSGTIKKNIISSESYDEKKFQHAVSLAKVDHFANLFSSKYDTKIGDNGINLSQGQKQRILLARTIYKNPNLIILDEATSSLDANNEKNILENLQVLLKEKTVFIVAHRLSTITNADLILVLEQGRIIEHGTHSVLVDKRGYYYKLIRSQLDLGV